MCVCLSVPVFVEFIVDVKIAQHSTILYLIQYHKENHLSGPATFQYESKAASVRRVPNLAKRN